MARQSHWLTGLAGLLVLGMALAGIGAADASEKTDQPKASAAEHDHATGSDEAATPEKNLPSPSAAAAVTVATVAITPIAAPPAELQLDAFYTKYVSAHGFPVLSSDKVNDYALYEAAYLINLMLDGRPDVRAALIDGGARFVVIAHNEYTTEIPEYGRLEPKVYWDRRARGLGGSGRDPVCSCGEENLLCYDGDPYHEENILIHEFAHMIHLRGMNKVDPTFDQRVRETYKAAMGKELWKDKYAGVNKNEYFAEGVQSWFNNNRLPDHDHNHVNTRAELIEYDPGLAALCKEVFGERELKYLRPNERDEAGRAHLRGYDGKDAPKFAWPEGLQEKFDQYMKENNRKR